MSKVAWSATWTGIIQRYKVNYSVTLDKRLTLDDVGRNRHFKYIR